MRAAKRAWDWVRPRVRWRDVVMVALVGASILFTVTYVRSTEREFCQVISGVTEVAVPRPADPAANPSREKQYELYMKFVSLGGRLGC